MRVRPVTYRAWKVENESEEIHVVWIPGRGFNCEKCGTKREQCEHIKAVIDYEMKRRGL